MVTKESLFIVFALFAKFLGATSLPTEKESLKRDEYDTNAFSNDINKCLFTAWTTASGNPNAVLSKSVECKGYKGSHVQLCYGLEPPKAQFAACYNKETLTPDFTGHIVEPDIEGAGREDEWREDKGTFAPVPQSKVEDYDPYSQKGLFDNYDIQKQYFLAKGHLTPNADFNTDDERLLTMITTNIAPQWQKFNSENWSGLERGVRRCASTSNRNLYVFTGVGGKARNLSGEVIYLKRRVLTPRWFWKAVCDPVAKQSIVFVGENSVGIASQAKAKGCNMIEQTKDKGIVYCMSHQEASRKFENFKLPPFQEKNCKPSKKGTFMDNFLNGLK